MMKCSVSSLCDKDVICVTDGQRIGTVGDVEFDCETGKIVSIIICGKQGFFGVVGRSDDIRIKWCDVDVIGDDTILVKCADLPPCPRRK